MNKQIFCPVCKKGFSADIKFCPHDGTKLIVSSENKENKTVLDGRYRVLYKIGEGGMGAVYKAIQISTDKTVAIKVISSSLTNDPDTIKRFQREVKIQCSLDHPNIVTVIDFSKTREGRYFFVMGYVEGKSVKNMIKEQGKFSLDSFYELASQMLDGMEYAHQKGIIHRDIKGDNVIVASMGHQQIVKILDFGIAKLWQGQEISKDDTYQTQQGMVLGTPAYMSPEQAKGEKDKIGPGSDIYSLGIVFYQMLTGKLPFESDTPWGYLHKHATQPPRPLRLIDPSIPIVLEKMIMRCLEKKPEERYPSALLLKQDLTKVAGQSGGEITQLADRETVEEIPPDNFWSGWKIAAIILLLLAVVAGSLMRGCDKKGEKDKSSREIESQVESVEEDDPVEKRRELRRLLKQVREAARKGQIDVAEEALNRAEEIAPDAPIIDKARRRLNKLRNKARENRRF